MVRRKPAPDLIRGGHRFADKNMRHSITARARPDSEGTGCARVPAPREVTLSGKGAKSRTRGRNLHSTGTKARVGRTRRPRADLEQQLEASRREIDHARERLIEAKKQQ